MKRFAWQGQCRLLEIPSTLKNDLHMIGCFFRPIILALEPWMHWPSGRLPTPALQMLAHPSCVGWRARRWPPVLQWSKQPKHTRLFVAALAWHKVSNVQPETLDAGSAKYITKMWSFDWPHITWLERERRRGTHTHSASNEMALAASTGNSGGMAASQLKLRGRTCRRARARTRILLWLVLSPAWGMRAIFSTASSAASTAKYKACVEC